MLLRLLKPLTSRSFCLFGARGTGRSTLLTAPTYLKEEVWGEHLVRNLGPFRGFLSVAAQMNGKLINYTKNCS